MYQEAEAAEAAEAAEVAKAEETAYAAAEAEAAETQRLEILERFASCLCRALQQGTQFDPVCTITATVSVSVCGCQMIDNYKCMPNK